MEAYVLWDKTNIKKGPKDPDFAATLVNFKMYIEINHGGHLQVLANMYKTRRTGNVLANFDSFQTDTQNPTLQQFISPQSQMG